MADELFPDVTSPEDDELKKEKERLAQIILLEEAQTGQRSSKRDLLGAADVPLTEPSLPIDHSWRPAGPLKITVGSSTADYVPPPAVESENPNSNVSDNLPDNANAVPNNIPVPLPDEAFEKPKNWLEKTQENVGKVTERFVERPVRQFASSLAGNAAKMITLPMAATQIPGAFAGDQGSAKMLESLLNTGEQAQQAVRQGVGAPEKPRDFGERLAALAGESLTPAGKATVPLSLAMAGVNHTMSPAEAAEKKPRMTKEQRAEFEQNRRVEDAKMVVQTIAGPQKVKQSDYTMLGAMVLGTAGLMFAPKVYSKIKTGFMPNLPSPKMRPVENAAPGTQTFSNAADYARTMDDVNAGVVRMARRAGLAPDALKRIEDAFKIQTRSAATSIAQSAINRGKANSINFQFQSKVPLADLARMDNPQVRQYLHLRDTIDDLNIKQTVIAAMSARKQAKAGTPTVRGHTIATALRELHSLEQANPQLKQIAAAYQDILKNQRKFMAQGEYAILSQKENAKLAAQRPNEVHWKGKRDDNYMGDRGSAFQSLGDDMLVQMRRRMENEARGRYIDEMKHLGLFKRVSPEQVKNNPKWVEQGHVVEMWRRGKKEYYTTESFLADVLKFDPYFMNSMSGMMIGTLPKRWLEATSTGFLAPWFAVTSAVRNHKIARMTTEEGFKSPHAWHTIAAIPQQLMPQLQKAISSSLDRGGFQWLRNVFAIDDATAQAFSRKMAHSFERSLFARMDTVGTHKGSILEQQANATNQLNAAIKSAQGPHRAFLEGYKATLHAFHNAPAFAFARRNEKVVPLPELVQKSRSLTGDNRVGGQYYATANRPIKFEGRGGVIHTTAEKLAQGYGRATEFGRDYIPWFNATTQGIKRIGQAYLHHPIEFMNRAWLYSAMPAAASYFYTKSLGNDPNGRSYIDYMMNGRSEYQRTMNTYIPIPLLPAERGIEWPRFHELSPVSRMMEDALHHITGDAFFSNREDWAAVRDAFFKTALIPPLPPAGNVVLGSQGMTPVGNIAGFGEDSYRKKEEPFNQYGGLPASLEMTTRAVAGGLIDTVGSFYAAFTNTPKGATDSVLNGLQASGRRMVERTPGLRDATGMTPAASGNTRMIEELFRKQKHIDKIINYITKVGDEVNISPVSKFGGEVTKEMGIPTLPSMNAGIIQPEPTNPVYKMFANEVYNRFKLDDYRNQGGDIQGGMGYKTMLRRYGNTTEHLQHLRMVNPGNNVTWLKQLEQRPETVTYLKSQGIDPTNVVQVRNHLERVRQEIGMKVLQVIRNVEEKFSKDLGRPVRLEDLDPYAKAQLSPGSGLLSQQPSGL